MKPHKVSKFKLSAIRAKKGAGFGLKTEDDIRRGAFVIEYYGPILKVDDADQKGGKYLFELNDKYIVDGTPRYNLARYINHSCRPNCETDTIGRRVYVYAKRNIKKGEELTYDYGKEYFNDFIKKLGCKCIKCTEKRKRKK